MALYFKAKILLATLAGVVFVFVSAPNVHADNLQVTAKIDFPAPTQAAVIDPEIENVIVDSAYFTVYGTCEIASPAYIITIQNDGTETSSGTCDSTGKFSINITLHQGANRLVARTVNVSSLYGPDSNQVLVTLNLPINPPDQTPQIPTPAPNYQEAVSVLPPNEQKSINSAAASNLWLNSTKTFSLLDDQKNTTITFMFDGGESPYTIAINWGDGSTESMVLDRPGKYEFSHSYAKFGVYIVHGELKDATGAITRFEHVITTTKVIPSNLGINATTPTNFNPSQSLNYFAIIVGVAVITVSVASFVLGRISVETTMAISGNTGRMRHYGTIKKGHHTHK
jgi:hypothetical protein